MTDNKIYLQSTVEKMLHLRFLPRNIYGHATVVEHSAAATDYVNPKTKIKKKSLEYKSSEYKSSFSLYQKNNI